MSSFPPRASYAMSPHLRTPDTDNNGLALVPITTKDPSPGAGAYPNGRSPLGSLGTNNQLGLGVRQRRPTNQSFESSPYFNGGEIKGPPRASLTMSMGGSGGSGLIAPRPPSVKNDMSSQLVDTSGYRSEMRGWVLVYGFSNKDQCGEVLRKFRCMGNVTEVKMASGNKNWLALSYDSNLAVEKAASEKNFQLSDGCFCGVQKLTNSHEFFLHQQRMYSSVTTHNINGDNIQESINLFPPAAKGSEETMAELNEADILMVNTAKGPTRDKNCLESLLGWIYGW